MISKQVHVAESQKLSNLRHPLLKISWKFEEEAFRFMGLFPHPSQLGNYPSISCQKKACYWEKLIQDSPDFVDEKHCIEKQRH